MRRTALRAIVLAAAGLALVAAALQLLTSQPKAPSPHFPPPKDRIDAWRQDLTYLRSEFLRVDRTFTDASSRRFLAILDSLESRIETLSENGILVEITRAVASSGNAHTRVYLMRNDDRLRRLPVRFWWFADGLYVVRSTADLAHLLGARVMAIQDAPPEHLRRDLRELVSGTDSWVSYMSTYYLNSPDFLEGIGVLANPESVQVTMRIADGAPFTLALPTLPPSRREEPYEAWRDLSPVATGNLDGTEWRHVLPPRDLPFHLRRPDAACSYDYLRSQRVLYLQLTRNASGSTCSQADFSRAVAALADSIEPIAVVLDVRFNTGGDYTETTKLSKGIPSWFPHAKRIYIVTGPATFSAGIVTAARLKYFASDRAVIIGEPAGDGLTMWSEGPTFILPNSKLRVKAATAYHDFATGRFQLGKTYFPDLFHAVAARELNVNAPVSVTFQEYRAGRDPVLERILANP